MSSNVCCNCNRQYERTSFSETFQLIKILKLETECYKLKIVFKLKENEKCMSKKSNENRTKCADCSIYSQKY